MTGPIRSLVLARVRRRGLTTPASIGAIVAAVAMVAILAGIGAIATERSLERALSSTGPERPVIRVGHFSASDHDLATVAGQADRALSSLGRYADGVVRGVITRELVDLDAEVFDLVVAIDDPGPWTTVLEGRLPAPCTPDRCEALLASKTVGPAGFDTARPTAALSLPIVGRGLIDPAVPFEGLDQSGPVGERPALDYQTDRRTPAVLLVNGVDALATHESLSRTGRTYIWAAPLRPDSVHAWTAEGFDSAAGSVARQLADDDAAFTFSSPGGRIGLELDRANAARGRLLLIGSLSVAILLAFAVFAAIVGRADLAAESARLRALGARRRDEVGFLLLEALVPVAMGGLVGLPIGLLITAGLAAAVGVSIGPLLLDALLAPGPILATTGILSIALLAFLGVNAPSGRRGGAVRAAAAAALTAVALVGWQLLGSGALDATALSRSLANPLVVVLPPALAFVVALGFLAILPVVLRATARRLRSAPLAIRLSLLSVSRDPVRPAATLTLLAFSLGAIVFAAGWSASLSQGIEDQAAHRSGLDLRVVELGTSLSVSQSVVPVARYEGLGDDVTAVPIFRGSAEVAESGRVEVLAIPPAAIPSLPGWRADDADRPVDELAAAAEVAPPPTGWVQAGHQLPPGAADLELDFRYDGDPMNLTAVVETPDGDHVRLPLGTIRDGMTSADVSLPASAMGGTLIALEFTHSRLIYGSHQHELRRATVTFEGVVGLVDPTPIEVEVFTVGVWVIRAPQPTDGLVLPAIVSPELAAAVDPDGILRLNLGGGSTLQVRVAGVARHFPTVVEAHPRFAVVALEPWLLALNAEAPAAGRPNEMWLATSSPARTAEVRAALATDPFRFPAITDRAALITERAGDPLSQSVAWALVVAGLAGLILSVLGVILGAATDLRDERGELADLETQGLPPSGLRVLVLARTAWLVIGGAIAGLAVGVVLTTVVTSALAVTAEGTLPIPPLRVVVPILPIAAAVGAVAVFVLMVVAGLARRAYDETTRGSGRRARRPASTRASLPPGTESIDG